MRWTEEEKKFLDDNKDILDSDQLSEALPGRTAIAVATALTVFGLQRNPKAISRMRGPTGKDNVHWKGGKAVYRVRQLERSRKYMEDNPEKTFAGNIIHKLVKNGELPRLPRNMVRHHPDYSKPEEFVIMTRSDHRRLHVEENRLR